MAEARGAVVDRGDAQRDRASCPRAARGRRRRPSRWPSAATTRLTATPVPCTSRMSPLRTPRSAVRVAPGPPSPAAGHGASQPVRPLPSRNTCVGSTPVAASTPGSRASCAAVPAGQRRAVAAGDDVGRLDPRLGHGLRVVAGARGQHALAADQHRDQQDRRRQRGAAPAVGGQPGAREQAGRAEQPQRPRQQRGRQAEQPAPEQRGPRREQDRREDRERGRLLAVEQQRHRGAAGERRPRRRACARTPGRPCSTATSRSASAGRTRPARRAAATTATCATPMPIPSAATSGIQEWPGSKPAGTTPWSASTLTIARASGPPASRPSPLATRESRNASVAIRRRTWRGVAPRARSTAVSRRRWAIASANVPATTNSATAPAIPPIVPKIETSVARSDARRVAGVGVRRVVAVEHLDPRAQGLLASRASQRAWGRRRARRRRRSR